MITWSDVVCSNYWRNTCFNYLKISASRNATITLIVYPPPPKEKKKKSSVDNFNASWKHFSYSQIYSVKSVNEVYILVELVHLNAGLLKLIKQLLKLRLTSCNNNGTAIYILSFIYFWVKNNIVTIETNAQRQKNHPMSLTLLILMTYILCCLFYLVMNLDVYNDKGWRVFISIWKVIKNIITKNGPHFIVGLQLREILLVTIVA